MSEMFGEDIKESVHVCNDKGSSGSGPGNDFFVCWVLGGGLVTSRML